MKKSYSVITISVFLAIMIFFTGFSVFGKKAEFSENENRNLQQLPAFSAQAIDSGEFQSEYNDYLSDQFPFRDFWVTGKTSFMRALGKKDTNGVYFGKNGYLIERYEESDYNPETINYNIETLSAFLNQCADDGYNVECGFIPSKAAALPDMLPKYAEIYDSSYVVNGVKEKCNEDVKFTDFSETFGEHQNEYIYYKTDHHWTSLGAYYAYRELMEQGKKKSILDINALGSEEVTNSFLGSTYDKVRVFQKGDTITRYDTGIEVEVNLGKEYGKTDSLYFPDRLEIKSKYEYFLGGNYPKVTIKTNAKSNKTLLLIKDSYSNSLVPFLVNNYKKIVMLDLRYYNKSVDDILENDDFDDIFVIYNTEKFMVDENQSSLEPYEEHELTEEEEENERILEEIEEEEREAGLLDDEE